jgi:hypothetical protein
MKHLKKLGLASALALVATCGLVGSATATTITPASTSVTLTSTNSSLAVSGGGAVSCTHSTISGTTPASGGTTWVSIDSATNTLTYTGCTAFFLPASVTPNAACHSTARPVLHVMFDNPPPVVANVVTLRATCSIDVSIPAIGCTLTIAGPQTIGNGTAGAGGIRWTNLSPLSRAHINAATVPSVVSNGVGAGCSTAGAHTGTLTGTYNQVSGSPVTVTP